MLLSGLLVSLATQAADRVNARILEYEDGSRRLERVETPGQPANYGTVSTANARSAGALVGKSGSRGVGSGAGAGGGSGGAGAGSTSGSARSGGITPKIIPPGEGVELIVGGKSEGGVAAKTTLPILE